MKDSPNWCPTLKPTEAEFRQPFTEFVSDVFRQDPGLPMFKVVPPPSWRPRRGGLPDLKSVCIDSPIRQHAFGQKGAYRCMFVEHRPLQVSEFREIALSEADRLTGHKGQSGSAAASGVVNHTQRRLESRRALHDEEDLMERSFWSSVTICPPLYGSDTHHSLFDEKLPYGWNLRNLGDLLKTKPVPDIPGVTTPMTYFGMWRSFFGWHKEDVDLYSINYHHFGAPKVWYCISPNDQAKFERLTASLFPDEAQECSNFMRHKDILISPGLLRSNNISFVQAKQQPGEFIVLNAGAYHGGFNLGFNCAEAVNFATEDWVQIGKSASRCQCQKGQNNVRISMSLFDPNWHSDVGENENESEETNFGSETGAEGFSPRQGLTDPSLLYAAMRRRARGGVASKPRRSGTRPRVSQQAKRQRLLPDSGLWPTLGESPSSQQQRSNHGDEADEDLILAVGRRLLGMSSPGSTGTLGVAGSGSSSEAMAPAALFQQQGQQGLGLSTSTSIPSRDPPCHPSPVFGGVVEDQEEQQEQPSSLRAGGFAPSAFQLPPALRQVPRLASNDGLSEPSSHEYAAEEGGQRPATLMGSACYQDQPSTPADAAEDMAGSFSPPIQPPFTVLGQPLAGQGMRAQGFSNPLLSRSPTIPQYQHQWALGSPYGSQLMQGKGRAGRQDDMTSRFFEAIASYCQKQGQGTPVEAPGIKEQYQRRGTSEEAQEIMEQYKKQGGVPREIYSDEEDEENAASPAELLRLPSKAQLQSVYHMPVLDASRALGVSFVAMKKSCRLHDIGRWPYRKLMSMDRVLESMRLNPTGDAESDEMVMRDLIALKAEVYENPRLEFDDEIKRLRQAHFKRQFKLRAKACSDKPYSRENLERRQRPQKKKKKSRS